MTIEALIKENTEALRALCERLDKLLAQGAQRLPATPPAPAPQAPAPAVAPAPKTQQSKVEKPTAPAPVAVSTPTTVVDKQQPDDPGAKLTRIRELVAKKGVGHADTIRALLLEHGAPSASKLDPVHYDAVLAKLEAL